ncbi:DUF427 domain-containing protein [Paenibacillus sp. MMO-177]|uniref:DUF427 domain-containing protein n=1 Tax=Paenibacillus sp. MMO-177 TaxID=3081289 RepID=UPI003018BC39
MVHFDPQWSLRDIGGEDWQIRAERSPRWIRVKFGDIFIADSKRVLVVTETGKLPVYYFPKSDVRTDLLLESPERELDPNKGEATYLHVDTGHDFIERAAWTYSTPTTKSLLLADYIAFVWKKADAWYEEEEEIFVHARDPYTRIDALPSSRHVQVWVGGQIIADSRNSVILLETGLTPRYYLPKEDIAFEYLIPSETITRCPYKGLATYHTVSVGDNVYKDVVWQYENPLPEVHEIAGRYSFYNEAVDAIIIDGETWVLRGEDRLAYGNIGKTNA